MKRLLLLLMCSVRLFADGGTVVLAGTSDGRMITVFAAPSPPRAGALDLSVLVQRESDGEPILNAKVMLRLNGGEGEATHAMATNKLLYSTTFHLNRAGSFSLEVQADSSLLKGQITLLPAEAPVLPYWPYLAVVPAGILLFVLNQRLKANRNRTRAKRLNSEWQHRK